MRTKTPSAKDEFRIVMTVAIVFIIVLFSGCSLEPKHVEFEPYRSPNEIEQRLQTLDSTLRIDPSNVNLQLECAELLVEQRKINIIVDEFVELGVGPSSQRLYTNQLLWKRTDSLLAQVLAADSSNARALEIRLANYRVKNVSERNWYAYAARSLEKPWYIEDTIPHTILSLLKYNPSQAGEYRSFAAMADTMGHDREKEALVKMLRFSYYNEDVLIKQITDDSPFSGEAWANLSKAFGGGQVINYVDLKKIVGLRAIRFGVRDRWRFLTNPYLYISGFDAMRFFEAYRKPVRHFPSISQFIFFRDMARFAVPELTEKESREYVINDLIKLNTEYPKLILPRTFGHQEKTLYCVRRCPNVRIYTT
jgi:hypothetical protein